MPAKIPEIEAVQSVFSTNFAFEDFVKENASSENVTIKKEVDIKMESEEEKVVLQQDMNDSSREAEVQENAEVMNAVQENSDS